MLPKHPVIAWFEGVKKGEGWKYGDGLEPERVVRGEEDGYVRRREDGLVTKLNNLNLSETKEDLSSLGQDSEDSEPHLHGRRGRGRERGREGEGDRGRGKEEREREREREGEGEGGKERGRERKLSS